MPDHIAVTPEGRPQPQLRKLARALIALARRESAAESREEAKTQSENPPGEAP